MISQNSGDANAAINGEFRRILVERVKDFLHRGDPEGGDEFSTLLRHSPYVQAQAPQLAVYLDRYPTQPLAGSESLATGPRKNTGGSR